jgi:FeS assembly SUF system protein
MTDRDDEVKRINDDVIAAVRTVFDPEIPVNIYELGLIYKFTYQPGTEVDVEMTLTSPNCPVAETLPVEVREAVEAVEGVSAARVHIVWEPEWSPMLMSEAAKLELGMM